MSTIPRNKQREHKLYRMAIADPDDFEDVEAGLVGLNKRVDQEVVSLPRTDKPRRVRRRVIGPITVIEEPMFMNTPPVVMITTPPDGSDYEPGDMIPFAGMATDLEDGDLTAFIVWKSNIDGMLGVGGSVPISTLSSGTHTITASVIDSGGKTGSDSITVIVNATPVVSISDPPDGSTYSMGETIDFAATAIDLEDGDITASIVWTSSIDGVFGSGGNVSISTLSVGIHTIIASATDSGGKTGSDSITVTVLSDPYPLLEDRWHPPVGYDGTVSAFFPANVVFAFPLHVGRPARWTGIAVRGNGLNGLGNIALAVYECDDNGKPNNMVYSTGVIACPASSPHTIAIDVSTTTDWVAVAIWTDTTNKAFQAATPKKNLYGHDTGRLSSVYGYTHWRDPSVTGPDDPGVWSPSGPDVAGENIGGLFLYLEEYL